jgi:hypothetical protein
MKKYKIGYCPTMQPYVDAIEKGVEEVEMLEFGSAGGVLAMLRNGQLDGVLIGRIAYPSELDNETKFVRLKDGITLAFKVKYSIPEEQLNQVDVVTYLKPEQVAHVKHFFHNIVFYNTLDKCLQYNLEVPVLVDWRDFREDFELLIPMNQYGKTQEFRAPVIYHHDIDDKVIEKVKGLNL